LLFIYEAFYFICYSILFFFVTYRVGYPHFQSICWAKMAMDFGAHAALADYVVDATEALSFRSVGDYVIRVKFFYIVFCMCFAVDLATCK
jgi:hypothetical protein